MKKIALNFDLVVEIYDEAKKTAKYPTNIAAAKYGK
jgi:hypothetical protein